MTTNTVPENYKRNFLCLSLDFACFGIAMSLFNPTTVIPGFLTVLGASTTVIGLMSTLQRAGWLLPQLIAARSLTGRPHKKPIVLWGAGISRSSLLVLSVVIWATGARIPGLMIALVAATMVFLFVGDGVASVAWFDLFSKSIPANRRGRLTGVGQVLSGISGFLAGFFVEWMLSEQGFAFPNNYASLFLIAFVMLTLSFIAIAFIVEPKSNTAPEAVPSWRAYLPQLWSLLKHDDGFRRYTIARQFWGISGLATPFYMTYALDHLQLPEKVAGRYTSIGLVGSILAAVLFGWLNERKGTRYAIQVSILATVANPLLALLLPKLPLNLAWMAWIYSLVFFAMNISTSSGMPAWIAYVLELAPDDQRPLYVGLTNTLSGITTLFSTLGGFILQWTGNNYDLLFILTAIGTLLTWLPVARMPEPRLAAEGQGS